MFSKLSQKQSQIKTNVHADLLKVMKLCQKNSIITLKIIRKLETLNY